MPGTIGQASSKISDYVFYNEHEKSLGDGIKGMAHHSCAKLPEVLIAHSRYFLPFMVDGTNIVIVRFRERTHLVLGSDAEVEREIKNIPIKYPKLNRRALISAVSSRIDFFLNGFMARDQILTGLGLTVPRTGDVPSLRSLVGAICMCKDHYLRISKIRDKALDLKAYLVRPGCDDAIVTAAWGLLQVRDVMTS